MDPTNKPTVAPTNALEQVVRTLRLLWRLFRDSRVSLLPKLIPIAALVYVVSPIDLVPDFILGLGQLDDLGIVMLGIALFIELCPKEIVAEHRRALGAQTSASRSNENVVDGTYRVIHDDEPSRENRRS
jgi:uncharacterized membrane protein YkvA (DUF1232 family)